MSILSSREMFINMKNPPVWDRKRSFYEQDKETYLFYKDEKQKITNGVNIGGYFMHPWLYFHINYFKTVYPCPKRGIDVFEVPPLNDNFMYIIDTYQEAERLGKGMCVFGTRGFNKALRNDELLHYEDGWRPIGNAKKGDKIYGQDGKLTTITGVFPQGVVDLYRVTLLDGREVICCDEHLWEVFDFQARKTKVLPLKEILKGYKHTRKYTGYKYKDGKTRIAEINNYYIRKNDCLSYEEKDLTIDPYYLGLFLGDGTRGKTDITTIDDEIIDYLKGHAENKNLIVTKTGKYGYKTSSAKKGSRNPLTQELKELGVLHTKHIPDNYLYSSKEQRLELLRGLLDTDGCVSKKYGQVSFCQANLELIKQVRTLVLSLGITCKLFEGKSEYILKNGERARHWVLTIYSGEDIFKLSRKRERLVESKTTNTFKRNYMAISEIVKIEPGEATCIKVDNEDKLFLTTNFVVTHNSSALASLTSWINTIKPNGVMNIIGGDEGDLKTISRLVKKAMGGMNHAFYIPTIISDWETHVEYGYKRKNNQDRSTYSEVIITNAEGGKDKKAEKGAGLSPTGFIMDEIGKFNPTGILRAALPGFKKPGGKRLVHVLSGTGGNEELSEGAKHLLTNPDDFELLVMDFDRLERGVPEEAITWKGDRKKTFGTFVPAQMSYRLEIPRLEKNLGEYLGQKDNPDLNKIKIMTTDWIRSTKELRRTLDGLKTLEAKGKQMMYYPTEIDHCFLTESYNPFPKEKIARRIEEIKNSGKTPKLVTIFKDNKGDYVAEFSDKKPATFRYEGIPVDAPILLFGDFPEKPPLKNTHASGMDGYKTDQAKDGSLGTNYVLKRRNMDPNTPFEKIVACYVARPTRMIDFNATAEVLVDAFSAKCLLESIDVSFKYFLDVKKITDKILAPAITFSNTAPTSPYGMYPSVGNNTARLNLAIQYTTEEYVIDQDREGNPIIRTGVDYIDDIDLLKEMLEYPNGSMDRLDGFSYALVLARDMDKKNILPKNEVDYSKMNVQSKKVEMSGPYSMKTQKSNSVKMSGPYRR